MNKERERTPRQIVIRLLFLSYCALMLWLLFGQRLDVGAAEHNWNLVPLQTLKLYVKMLQNTHNAYLFRHALINLVGNVLMFVPLGLFLPSIWPRFRSFWSCSLCLLLVIIAVELIQYLTNLGSCDVDDLILNVPGALIGWGIYRLRTRKRK